MSKIAKYGEDAMKVIYDKETDASEHVDGVQSVEFALAGSE